MKFDYYFVSLGVAFILYGKNYRPQGWKTLGHSIEILVK